MFIVERLFSVGVYCLVLLIAYALIAYSKISYKAVLRGYTLALSAMAFFYKPYVTADLYRIYETVQDFAAWDFNGFIETLVVGSSIPVARIYFWIFGKIGCLQLLPAVSTLICMSLIFYIFQRTAERYNISRKNFAAALLFFMATGNYMMLISNIRTMLALSVVSFCFFRESVEKKKTVRHILLYALAAGMHNLAVPIVLFRIIAPLQNKMVSLKRRVLYFLMLCMLCVGVMLFLQTEVQDIFDKFNDYVYGDKYSYFWEYLIAVLAMVMQVFALYYYRKINRHYPEFMSINYFLRLCIVVAMAFCFEFSVFYRLLTIMTPMLGTPVLMLVLQGGQLDRQYARETVGMRSLYLLGILMMLALACTRGSLCSIKFFVL